MAGTQLKNQGNNIFPITHVEDVVRLTDGITLEALLAALKFTADSHIADDTNPHSVTASQVGALTEQETEDLIEDKILEIDTDGLVKNPTWVNATFTLTLPIAGSAPLIIDLPVEQLIKGIAFDDATSSLILTLEGGGTQSVPLNALVVGLASEAWVTTQLTPILSSITALASRVTDLENDVVTV